MSDSWTNTRKFLNLKHPALGNYTTTEHRQKIKWVDIEVIKPHRDYIHTFFSLRFRTNLKSSCQQSHWQKHWYINIYYYMLYNI